MPLFTRENEFNHAFLAAATEFKIPVSVLKGFAALESAFNPKAFREEKAINDASYGLMQILNRTAKGEGFAGKPEDLFDPATNVKWGASFLKKLMVKYPNLPDAVASYNMGYPRKAKDTTSVIQKIYGSPQPDWIYANQPYVDRVLSFIAYYQAVENNDKAKAAEVLALLKKKAYREASRHVGTVLSGFVQGGVPAVVRSAKSDVKTVMIVAAIAAVSYWAYKKWGKRG